MFLGYKLRVKGTLFWQILRIKAVKLFKLLGLFYLLLEVSIVKLIIRSENRRNSSGYGSKVCPTDKHFVHSCHATISFTFGIIQNKINTKIKLELCMEGNY